MKQLNAKSSERVVIGRVLGGKAAFVLFVALPALTTILAVAGCSKSKSVAQAPKTSDSASPQAPALISTSPAVIVAPVETAKKKSVKGPVRKVASTRLYSDDASGISFRYPRKATLIAGDKVDAASTLPMNFIAGGGSHLVSLELPSQSKMGKELESSIFTISVNSDLTSQQCGQFAQKGDDDSSIVVQPRTLNGVEFSELHYVGEGETVQYDHRFVPASGNSTQKGACYEFGMVAPIDEQTDANKNIEHKHSLSNLEKIFASVKVNPEVKEVTSAVKEDVKQKEEVQTAKSEGKIEEPR